MSQDVSVTHSSLEGKTTYQAVHIAYNKPCCVCHGVLLVLITLLSQLSSQDIARKLMQRTVQSVSNLSNSVTHCACMSIYSSCGGLVSSPDPKNGYFSLSNFPKGHGAEGLGTRLVGDRLNLYSPLPTMF